MKGGMGAPGGDLPDGFAGKELKGEIGRDNLPDTTGGDVILAHRMKAQHSRQPEVKILQIMKPMRSAWI